MSELFGARFKPGEGTVFKLWAPDHNQVDLLLLPPTGEPRRLPLTTQQDGLFSHTEKEAAPGWCYQYFVDGQGPLPDPASRKQPEDAHGPSEIMDPAFPWTDQHWRGLDWSSAVIYELHVGTFTPAGTFQGVQSRLDYLHDLGINAIEIMPVADFPGKRNWGYDGTFLFAPDSAYGRPEDLKQLVDSCHARGIAIILDVVYNHFGPDGNYMWPISRQFFNSERHTPWGEALNISHPMVRTFFRENARFWIEEYHFDGFRFDAVHALDDEQRFSFLSEVRKAARSAAPERSLFLVLENPTNQAELLRDSGDGAFDAQWNDDFHHALHRLLTGEQVGVYQDHPVPEQTLERTLRHGFAYQGEYSHWRKRAVGTPTDGLTLNHFVNYIQTHDMVGNRALGERLHQLADRDMYKAAVALYLFLPSIPMLFMGEEYCAATPFLFFTDHQRKLGAEIRKGRLRQHSVNPKWREKESWEQIPHPQKESTFQASRIDWQAVERDTDMLDLYKALLALRAKFIGQIDQRQDSISVERNGRLFTLVLRNHRGQETVACVTNFEATDQQLPTRFSSIQWRPMISTQPCRDDMVPTYTTLWLEWSALKHDRRRPVLARTWDQFKNFFQKNKLLNLGSRQSLS